MSFAALYAASFKALYAVLFSGASLSAASLVQAAASEVLVTMEATVPMNEESTMGITNTPFGADDAKEEQSSSRVPIKTRRLL